MNIALNSQSSPGPGPGAPAAVGSLGDASPALFSPLYPAEPFLLAAGPHHTSSHSVSHDPDTQQTQLVFTGSKRLILHVDQLGCSVGLWMSLRNIVTEIKSLKQFIIWVKSFHFVSHNMLITFNLSSVCYFKDMSINTKCCFCLFTGRKKVYSGECSGTRDSSSF